MTWSIQSGAEQDAMREIVRAKSDRVTAILGSALVEHRLQEILIYRFRDDPKVIGRMFEPEGALHSFVPKIDLGYALHVYDLQTRNTLRSIARIRNLFAHRLALQFGDEAKKLTKELGSLRLHENRTHYPRLPFSDDDRGTPLMKIANNRDLFICNVQIALYLLFNDVFVHEAHTNAPSPPRFPAVLPGASPERP